MFSDICRRLFKRLQVIKQNEFVKAESRSCYLLRTLTPTLQLLSVKVQEVGSGLCEANNVLGPFDVYPLVDRPNQARTKERFYPRFICIAPQPRHLQTLLVSETSTSKNQSREDSLIRKQAPSLLRFRP
jgi:hypothetical protein